MTVVGNFYFSIFLRLTWEFLGLESERGGSVCWPNNKIIDLKKPKWPTFWNGGSIYGRRLTLWVHVIVNQSTYVRLYNWVVDACEIKLWLILRVYILHAQDAGIISCRVVVVPGRETGGRLVPAAALGAPKRAAAAAPLPLPHVCPPQPLLALTRSSSSGDHKHLA